MFCSKIINKSVFLHKFLMVALLNTLVDLGVFNILLYLVNDKPSSLQFLLFKSASFSFAVINSYYLNSKWTFKCGNRENGFKGLMMSFFILFLLILLLYL